METMFFRGGVMKKLATLTVCLSFTGPALGQVLSEDFNGTFPPTDWMVVDNTGNGGWLLNTDYDEVNDTGGDGTAAAIDSDEIGWGVVDTELITPSFVVPEGATLEFDHSFRWYSGGLNEQADVDISVNGGRGRSWRTTAARTTVTLAVLTRPSTLVHTRVITLRSASATTIPTGIGGGKWTTSW